MKTFGNLPLPSILLLFLVTFTAAWPVWPRWLPDLDSLVVRQDNNNNSSSESNSPTSAQKTGSKTSDSSPSETGSTTGSKSTDSSGTSTIKSIGKSSSTSKKTSSTTTIDPALAAGGVSMITPAVSSGAQYYKIGQPVTFVWNYTSLLSTPTAVNILATCTKNSQLYTIAANQTVTNSTGAVTWDTGAYQATAVQDPLLTETYTLIIYDAASSISATAQAGLLAVYNQYTFGMYTPQPYTPLGEFKCVTCSGALSDFERKALSLVIGVSAITIMSFTWFVGGTGVIW